MVNLKHFTGRQVWNIYRQASDGKHYYHMSPWKYEDVLVKSNIDPAKGIELVNEFNSLEEKDENTTSRNSKIG